MLGLSEEDLEEKEDGRGRASRTSEIPRARTRFLQAPFAAPLQYALQETLLWLMEMIAFLRSEATVTEVASRERKGAAPSSCIQSSVTKTLAG